MRAEEVLLVQHVLAAHVATEEDLARDGGLALRLAAATLVDRVEVLAEVAQALELFLLFALWALEEAAVVVGLLARRGILLSSVQ